MRGRGGTCPHGSMAAAQTQPTRPLNPGVQAGGVSRQASGEEAPTPHPWRALSECPTWAHCCQGRTPTCGNACLELLIASLMSQHRGLLRWDRSLLAGPPCARVPCRYQGWQPIQRGPTKPTGPYCLLHPWARGPLGRNPPVRAASGHEGAKLPLLLLDSLAHARSTDWRPPVSGAPNDGQCLCSALGRKRKTSHGCPADSAGEAGGPPAVRTVQPAARAPCADDKGRHTSTEQQGPRRAGLQPRTPDAGSEARACGPPGTLLTGTPRVPAGETPRERGPGFTPHSRADVGTRPAHAPTA